MHTLILICVITTTSRWSPGRTSRCRPLLSSSLVFETLCLNRRLITALINYPCTDRSRRLSTHILCVRRKKKNGNQSVCPPRPVTRTQTAWLARVKRICGRPSVWKRHGFLANTGTGRCIVDTRHTQCTYKKIENVRRYRRFVAYM